MCESFVTPEFWNWSKASEYSVGGVQNRGRLSYWLEGGVTLCRNGWVWWTVLHKKAKLWLGPTRLRSYSLLAPQGALYSSIVVLVSNILIDPTHFLYFSISDFHRCYDNASFNLKDKLKKL